MAIALRQSTASQEVIIGPFLNDTDGNTPEGSLTIANTDIKLWKHGSTSEVNKNSGGATHIAGGRYSIVLDATDTNTCGSMEINVHVSGALAVRRECHVFEEAVYDAYFAASSTGTVGTAQTGDAYAALTSTLADSVPSDGTRPTALQALYMLIQFLTERSVSGTTVTVKKVDGSTTLMEFALNDDTAPTSITRSS